MLTDEKNETKNLMLQSFNYIFGVKTMSPLRGFVKSFRIKCYYLHGFGGFWLFKKTSIEVKFNNSKQNIFAPIKKNFEICTIADFS